MLLRLPTDKAARIAARFIPRDYVPYKPDDTGDLGAVYTTPAGAARPAAIGFTGSAGRSSFHFTFGTDVNRMLNYADSFIAGLKARAAAKATRSAGKAAWTNPLKAGDVLYTSWGYDQTNVEFFTVVKVSGRKLWLAELAQDATDTGFMSGTTTVELPHRTVGDVFTRLATPDYNGSAAVKISDSRRAHLWDGRPKHFSSYA